MKKVLDATNTYLYTVTYYDDYGRIIKTISDNQKGGCEIIANIYNFSGQVLKTTHKHILPNASDIYTTYRYVYDHRNRLREEYLTVGANPATDQEVLISAIEYDELGRVKNEKLHSVNQGKFLQKQDYTYNTRGWLKSLNGGDLSTSGDNDLFAYNLFYDKVDPLTGSTPLFNGNITAMTWNTNLNKNQGYKFDYDNINRLLHANFKQGGTNTYNVNAFKMDLDYDQNGNIKTLFRRNNIGALTDELYYNYATNDNRIAYIAKPDNGVPLSSLIFNYYAYDQNGNMISDNLKNINNITYNYLNLPENIYLTLGRSITYKYDATGAKLRKEVYVNNALQDAQDYVGNFVYDNNANLLFIGMDKGRLVPYNGTYRFEYFLKDHLGNTRVTFTAAGEGIPLVLQEDHYYPFGMTMPNLSYSALTTNANKFMYNGKELQSKEFGSTGLDWYDYGARMFDPITGRFWVIDPMAVFTPGISPYTYANNDPIDKIDYYGLGPISDWIKKHILHNHSLAYYKSSFINSKFMKSIDKHLGNMDAAGNVAWGGTHHKSPNSNHFISSPSATHPYDHADPIASRSALLQTEEVVEELQQIEIRHSDPPVFRDHVIPPGGKLPFTQDISYVGSSDKFFNQPLTDKILKDLVNTLKDYNHLKLFILGNVDMNTKLTGNTPAALGQGIRYKGRDKTAGELMIGRAQAVYNYLISKGIDPDRLDFGTGNVFNTKDNSGMRTSFILSNPK